MNPDASQLCIFALRILEFCGHYIKQGEMHGDEGALAYPNNTFVYKQIHCFGTLYLTKYLYSCLYFRNFIFIFTFKTFRTPHPLRINKEVSSGGWIVGRGCSVATELYRQVTTCPGNTDRL